MNPETVVDNDIRATLRTAKELAAHAVDRSFESIFMVMESAPDETMVPLTMAIIVGLQGTLRGIRSGLKQLHPECSAIIEEQLAKTEKKPL